MTDRANAARDVASLPLRWTASNKAPPARAVSLDSGTSMRVGNGEFVMAPSASHLLVALLPAHALSKTKAQSDHESGDPLNSTAAEPTPMKPANAVDVFLAGSCNPTTWRRDTVMPLFDEAKINYYNPQVDECATRAIVGINEAVEFICRGRRIILVVQDIQLGTVLEGATVTAKELVELNGARAYLRRLALQRGVRLYDDVAEAAAETTMCLAEKTPSRLASEMPRLRRRSSLMLNQNRGGTSVFLGGTLQSTSWRETVAIPRLQKAGLPCQEYYSSELQRLRSHHTLDSLVLFVIPNRTRSIAAMIEAVELNCSHLAMVLVIEPLAQGYELDDGGQLDGREFKDVARARSYLQEMAERHHVHVFPSVAAAVDGIIQAAFRG